MTIKTKFNIGDKVFTIDTCSLKIKEFVIDHISTLSEGNKTIVTLYDGESYLAQGYDESKCFPTEAELMTFISTNNDAKTL